MALDSKELSQLAAMLGDVLAPRIREAVAENVSVRIDALALQLRDEYTKSLAAAQAAHAKALEEHNFALRREFTEQAAQAKLAAEQLVTKANEAATGGFSIVENAFTELDKKVDSVVKTLGETIATQVDEVRKAIPVVPELPAIPAPTKLLVNGELSDEMRDAMAVAVKHVLQPIINSALTPVIERADAIEASLPQMVAGVKQAIITTVEAQISEVSAAVTDATKATETLRVETAKNFDESGAAVEKAIAVVKADSEELFSAVNDSVASLDEKVLKRHNDLAVEVLEIRRATASLVSETFEATKQLVQASAAEGAINLQVVKDYSVEAVTSGIAEVTRLVDDARKASSLAIDSTQEQIIKHVEGAIVALDNKFGDQLNATNQASAEALVSSVSDINLLVTETKQALLLEIGKAEERAALALEHRAAELADKSETTSDSIVASVKAQVASVTQRIDQMSGNTAKQITATAQAAQAAHKRIGAVAESVGELQGRLGEVSAQAGEAMQAHVQATTASVDSVAEKAGVLAQLITELTDKAETTTAVIESNHKEVFLNIDRLLKAVGGIRGTTLELDKVLMELRRYVDANNAKGGRAVEALRASVAESLINLRAEHREHVELAFKQSLEEASQGDDHVLSSLEAVREFAGGVRTSLDASIKAVRDELANSQIESTAAVEHLLQKAVDEAAARANDIARQVDSAIASIDETVKENHALVSTQLSALTNETKVSVGQLSEHISTETKAVLEITHKELIRLKADYDGHATHVDEQLQLVNDSLAKFAEHGNAQVVELGKQLVAVRENFEEVAGRTEGRVGEKLMQLRSDVDAALTDNASAASISLEAHMLVVNEQVEKALAAISANEAFTKAGFENVTTHAKQLIEATANALTKEFADQAQHAHGALVALVTDKHSETLSASAKAIEAVARVSDSVDSTVKSRLEELEASIVQVREIAASITVSTEAGFKALRDENEQAHVQAAAVVAKALAEFADGAQASIDAVKKDLNSRMESLQSDSALAVGNTANSLIELRSLISGVESHVGEQFVQAAVETDKAIAKASQVLQASFDDVASNIDAGSTVKLEALSEALRGEIADVRAVHISAIKAASEAAAKETEKAIAGVSEVLRAEINGAVTSVVDGGAMKLGALSETLRAEIADVHTMYTGAAEATAKAIAEAGASAAKGIEAVEQHLLNEVLPRHEKAFAEDADGKFKELRSLVSDDLAQANALLGSLAQSVTDRVENVAVELALVKELAALHSDESTAKFTALHGSVKQAIASIEKIGVETAELVETTVGSLATSTDADIALLKQGLQSVAEQVTSGVNELSDSIEAAKRQALEAVAAVDETLSADIAAQHKALTEGLNLANLSLEEKFGSVTVLVDSAVQSTRGYTDDAVATVSEQFYTKHASDVEEVLRTVDDVKSTVNEHVAKTAVGFEAMQQAVSDAAAQVPAQVIAAFAPLEATFVEAMGKNVESQVVQLFDLVSPDLEALARTAAIGAVPAAVQAQAEPLREAIAGPLVLAAVDEVTRIAAEACNAAVGAANAAAEGAVATAKGEAATAATMAANAATEALRADLLKALDPTERIASLVETMVPHEVRAAVKETIEDVEPRLEVKLTARLQAAFDRIPLPRDGRDGRDAKDGVNGRDAKVLAPVPYEHGKYYEAQTWVAHANGIWVAGRGTDTEPTSDSADWDCVVPGVKAIEPVLLEDGRTLELHMELTNGSFTKSTLTLPIPILRGTYDATREYGKDDLATYDGSQWAALRKGVLPRPGSDANAWRLVVKHGKDGKDLKQPAPQVIRHVGEWEPDKEYPANVTVDHAGVRWLSMRSTRERPPFTMLVSNDTWTKLGA